MEKSLPAKRKYDSSRRQQQARETRQQIAEVARGLFIERGYAGTTIDAIAQAAAVAPETVYAIFGNKRKVFWHLVIIAVGGDDQPVRLLDRPERQAILRDRDSRRQLQMFSRDMSQILARVAPIFEVMRSAAKTEPEIAGLLDKFLRERLANITIFAGHITALRPGLDAPAAGELIWTITSPEVFLLLTRDRGYSLEKVADWLDETLSRLLLPDQSSL